MVRDYGDPDCAIACSLGVLGDGWTLMVMREALVGTRRFADFEARLMVSKNILSKRLAHLVEHGLLAKVEVGQFGQRSEYELTPKGGDLCTVLTAIRQWGDRWIFGPGHEPLLLVDRATDEPVLPIAIRRKHGALVPAKDLVVRPGPGATPELIKHWAEQGLDEEVLSRTLSEASDREGGPDPESSRAVTRRGRSTPRRS